MSLFLLLLTVLSVAFAADDKEPAPEDAIEDPRALEQLAAAATSDDEKRELYRKMLKRQEVRKYLPYRKMLEEALILERMGDDAGAADKYREGMANDVLRTVQVLRILSVHPERDKLVEEAYDRVRGIVKAVEAGEKGEPIYTTSKGAPRFLKKLTNEEALAQAAAGKRNRYCYVDKLDLSKAVVPELPPSIVLDRCVVGSILAPDRDVGQLVFKGFVLGDVDVGKLKVDFHGNVIKGKKPGRTKPASRFEDLVFKEAVILGDANFSGITVQPKRAYFPMAVFDKSADFKGAEFWGATEFRFSSFGGGANFRDLRMHAPVYFGGARFRKDTVFTQVFSERDVYFNGVTFEGKTTFEKCEWKRSATFENSHFLGAASFANLRLTKRMNLSRTTFYDTLDVKEVFLGGLDAFGAWFQHHAYFNDAQINGRTRFSLDAVTRQTYEGRLDMLLPLYRDYQGDEDSDEPLTTKSSYGVDDYDDLTAQFDADVSFANTVMDGYTVFERVVFGTKGRKGLASFYNAQMLGETHFERSHWYSDADFTTIFGSEVAFNEAYFHAAFVLDDAFVSGRLALTDAHFDDVAHWSWYGAEIPHFQVDPSHVKRDAGKPPHRLFYEHCAIGEIDYEDMRIKRMLRVKTLDERALRMACYDRLIDEFVALKDAYGDAADVENEDNAYWWFRHYEAMKKFSYGDPFEKLTALTFSLLLFELCFGWGVQLSNLGIAVFAATAVFALLYRIFCPDTVISYDGDDIRIKDISYVGLFYISLQSLVAINTGWDFGDDDHTFRYLNTAQTCIGVIIVTFFVGAYTRLILA